MKRINSKLFFVVFFAIFSLFNIFCDNSVIHNPINTDKLPMWPELGYNGRRTGNKFNKNDIIPSVDGNNVFYNDTIGEGLIVNIPTVDSKGNIYFLLVLRNYINARLYKFDKNGKILWIYDDSTLMSSFGNGIGLSSDEKSIYIPCFNGLYCIDSSGLLQWKFSAGSIYSNLTMPAIGEDGTIYSVLGAYYLAALSPDGNLKWKVQGAMGAPSLDKEGNIYVGLTDGEIGGQNNGIAKFDKNGSMKWEFDLVKTPLSITIDANNNIYFQNSNQINTGLYSLNQFGKIRWSKTYHVGDSIQFSIDNTPLISKNNNLYVSAGWFTGLYTQTRGIMKLDTLGNEIFRTGIGTSGEWIPIDDIFFDSNENIYFHSVNEYGSIDKFGNMRFINNSFVSQLIININKTLFITKSDNTKCSYIIIK